MSWRLERGASVGDDGVVTFSVWAPRRRRWRCASSTLAAVRAPSCRWRAARTACSRRARRRATRAPVTTTLLSCRTSARGPIRCRASSRRACTARRASSTRRRSAGPTPAGAASRARDLGDLRAARRHVHARGHVRGRRRAAALPARPRRHRDRAHAGRGVPRRRGTGATTASTSTRRTPPTAGPTGCKRLVDACHAHGLALILDVVYNHLGPEGNYLADFGPYFTDRYRTPWGDALNFDGPDSDEVRRFFVDNALLLADASTTSTGCASTPSRGSSTSRRGRSCRRWPTRFTPRRRGWAARPG